MRYYLISIRRTTLNKTAVRKKKITSVGGGTEKLEPLHIVHRNVKWHSHDGKHYKDSSKTESRTTINIQQSYL